MRRAGFGGFDGGDGGFDIALGDAVTTFGTSADGDIEVGGGGGDETGGFDSAILGKFYTEHQEFIGLPIRGDQSGAATPYY